MFDKAVMELASLHAEGTMVENIGGPFGAAIVSPERKVVCVASNTVLGSHDPTAHAEINAIREACKKLGTHDLSGYTLYTTAYPCPMCLSAIIWANIKTVYYGCTAQDAEKIGFRDDFIYRFIEKGCKDEYTLNMKQIHREHCLHLFEKYTKENKQLY